MSSFTAPTFHPETGEIEDAFWMDEYFDHRYYGVRFPDGKVFDPHKEGEQCEQVLPKALERIRKLEAELANARKEKSND